jgi:hypothetical protein
VSDDCSIFIGGVSVAVLTPPMKMEQCCVAVLTPPVNMEQCSKTSAHKIQTPGNHLKERLQHSGHGKI